MNYGPLYSKLYDAISDDNQHMVSMYLQEYERNRAALTYVDIDDLFRFACREGNLEVVKYLYNEGAGLNSRDPDSQGTAIVMAAAFYRMSTAEWLVRQGVDVNTANNNGTSALHFASRYNQHSASRECPDMVLLLLKAGARINSTANNGKTPLHQAVGSCLANIVRILVENGASKTIRDSRGMTPLDTIADLINTMQHASVLELQQSAQRGIKFNTQNAMEIVQLLS
jgi:ankyrin repeat protein